MWLKLIGGIMVIVSSSMIGFLIAGNFKNRPNTLEIYKLHCLCLNLK